MASPLPVLRLPLPAPPPFPSSSAAARKPNPYAALPRSTVQWPMPNQCLTTGLRGFFRSNGGICLVPLAMSAAASVGSDGSTRLSVGHIRKLFDGFPQPIKSFPWERVISSFQNIFFELVWAAAKYLSVPLLAVTCLSEMSYCAHGRKIPIPFIVGLLLLWFLRIRRRRFSQMSSKEEGSLAFVSDCELLHITQIAWPILSILIVSFVTLLVVVFGGLFG